MTAKIDLRNFRLFSYPRENVVQDSLGEKSFIFLLSHSHFDGYIFKLVAQVLHYGALSIKPGHSTPLQILHMCIYICTLVRYCLFDLEKVLHLQRF
jgi:hypothetical protein